MTMAMPLANEFDAEEPVIEAIRAGDRYAFDEFTRRQTRWVRGVVFGVLGNRDGLDDVCQQIWSAVWQRATELRDTRSWRSWLYRMARNLAVDAGRDATRRRHRDRTPDLAAPPRETACPAQRAASVEQGHRVLGAIQGLPAIYREPFVLRHLNDWSYRQIADVMGLPVDSVETRLVRARRLLREALRGEQG